MHRGKPVIIRRISAHGAQLLVVAILLLGSILAYRGWESAQTSQFGPLGPAGAPANLFPSPNHQVPRIVSGEYQTEEARERTGETEEILNSLDIKAGMTVADLGAGLGYYTIRLARRVGPTGSVLAEDVTPSYLSKLQRHIAQEHLGNVTLVLGEPHDPRLPPHSVDLVLMGHMYHEVTQPFGLLYNLLPALRPGARVAVIEQEQADDGHAISHELLLCEFQSLGFRQINWRRNTGSADYFAIFDPPAQQPKLDAIAPCSR